MPSQTPIPVFTVSRPGVFASTSDRNHKFIKAMTGDRHLFCERLTDLYIDGELEQILGYDIPIWLSGTITGQTQDCQVWDVEGKICYDAEITYGHKNGHTYIRKKKTPLELMHDYKAIYGFWVAYPGHPLRAWRQEAYDGDTMLGYWEWVQERIEQEMHSGSRDSEEDQSS